MRSFVLREGRLTAAQARAIETLWPVYGLDWQPGQRLDGPALFGNDRPLALEIGFGNGESLAAMAAADPAANWLGIEVHRPGIGHLLLALEQRPLPNLRLLRQDADTVLREGLAPGALARLQIFFPDPWPKRRHHKRRLVSAARLPWFARALRPGGLLHLATDWEPYAEEMLHLLDRQPQWFANLAGAGHFAARPPERPLTRFEARGERLGHRVRDLLFQKTP